jgi:hypothetical protein
MLVFDALRRRDFVAVCEWATEFQRDILRIFHRRFIDPFMWKDAMQQAALCDELLQSQTERTLEFLESIHDEAMCLERHPDPGTPLNTPRLPDGSVDVVFFEITQPTFTSAMDYPFPWSLDEADRNCVEATFRKVYLRRGGAPSANGRKHRERMRFYNLGTRVCDQLGYVGKTCEHDTNLICATDVFYPVIIMRIVNETTGGSVVLDVGTRRDVGLREAWEGFGELVKWSIPGCTMLWVEDIWECWNNETQTDDDYVGLNLVS